VEFASNLTVIVFIQNVAYNYMFYMNTAAVWSKSCTRLSIWFKSRFNQIVLWLPTIVLQSVTCSLRVSTSLGLAWLIKRWFWEILCDLTLILIYE